MIGSWTALAASAAQIAIAIFLLAGVPFAAQRRTRKLLEELRSDPDARMKFYLRSMAGAWAVTIAVLLARQPPPALNVRVPRGGEPGWAVTFAVFAAFAVGIAATARRGRAIAQAMERLPERAKAILPRSARERRAWVAVSLTAGFCEELLYRGFLPALLTPLLAGAAGAAWLVSTAAFGMGHVYQGPRAVLGTALLGAIFALPTVLLESIWPAAVLHAAFNLRALTFPRPDVPLRARSGVDGPSLLC